MLGVSDRIADDLGGKDQHGVKRGLRRNAHVLKEDLEDTTGLLVDETGDTLHTTTTGETADGGLGNTLNVVAKNLAVTLRAALAETLGQ